MKAEYEAWISSYLQNHNPQGQCGIATSMMQAKFPELTRILGTIYYQTYNDCNELGELEDAHWWLKDPVGEIIDPTLLQFGVAPNTQPKYIDWKIRGES